MRPQCGVQKVRNSKGKQRISDGSGVGGPGDVAELELRLDLDVGAKSKEFLRKTMDFRGHWGGRTRGCRRN